MELNSVTGATPCLGNFVVNDAAIKSVSPKHHLPPNKKSLHQLPVQCTAIIKNVFTYFVFYTVAAVSTITLALTAFFSFIKG